MRVAAVLVLVGCYAPSAPSGVPCDPSASACPSGQHCVQGPSGHVCSAADGGLPADLDAAAIDAPSDAAPPPNVIQKTYTATVAECIAPMTPSPMLCRSLNGNAQLVIDIRDATTNQPWQAFIRFEVDDALQGKTITKVVLRMLTTTAANAPGPDSGSVFEVKPFTLSSLSMAAPDKVGAQLAGNQGAVGAADVVSWTLPPSLVTPGAPVYLGLFANDDDGVNYFNLDGATPPRLIVDAQ